MMEHKMRSHFKQYKKHFNLSNVEQISKYKSKGLSNQYLSLNDAMGDVVSSKPSKPMYVIFKGKIYYINMTMMS